MSAEGLVTEASIAEPAADAPPVVAAPRLARPSTSAFGSVSALVRTLRPKQWVKNIFVAAPLVFARHLGDTTYVIKTALAVLAFCALSGAVYAFNDVRDAASDRLHPTKRRRPIAAGQLSERAGLIWSGVLAVVALIGCAFIAWPLVAFAAAYLVQNVAYSVKLKHIAFVDVGLIASGFLLRVLGGAAAIDVRASGWLLLCTALLALFLGFGKRAHELAWAERNGRAAATRAALAGYRLDVLRAAMLVFGVVTCATFVGYTLDPHTIAFFGTDRLVYSAPFVLVGVVRFLSLALWRPTEESPTDAMLKDSWFLVAVAGAVAAILYAIYG
jgi:4-hydroxybenzoate polyprenyltransferase